MKRVAIIYSEYTPTIDALKFRLADYITDFVTVIENAEKYDLIINLGKEELKGNVIACHHSLLPVFKCEEPEKEAILNGIKVTGITIYYPNTKKIITQYPVFIDNDTHYDDLKKELSYLEQTMLPLVAEKIIKNEPFEIRALMNKSCKGSCGGCSSCSH